MVGMSLVHEREVIIIYRTISYRNEFNISQNLRKSVGCIDGNNGDLNCLILIILYKHRFEIN